MASYATVPIQLIPNPTSDTQKLINTLAVIQQQGQQNAIGDSLVGLPLPPTPVITGGRKPAKPVNKYVLQKGSHKKTIFANSHDEAALIGYWQITADMRPASSKRTVNFKIDSQQYRGVKVKMRNNSYKNTLYKMPCTF